MMRGIVCVLSIIAVPLRAPFFTISTPGVYQLGEDISYSSAGADTIVQISASDVVLDLGNHTLAQSGGAGAITGITVASNLSNITILNGSLQNLAGKGILINNNNSRIFLSALTFRNITDRVIDCAGTVGNVISNTKIEQCSIIQCCGTGGADRVTSFVFCNQLNLDDIQIMQCGAATHNTFGVYLEQINQMALSNSTTTSCVANASIAGIFANSSTNLLIKNYSARNLTSNSAAYGIQLNTVTRSLLINSSTININTVAGATARGFDITNNSNSNILLNCVALRNSSQTNCNGFALNNNSFNTLKGCISQFNQVTGAGGSANGILLNTTTGTKIVNSLFADQSAPSATANGLLAQTNSLLSICNNNICRNVGSAAATSFGINENAATNSSYIKNIVALNSTTAANQCAGLSGTQQSTAVLTTAVNTITQPFTNTVIT